MTDIHNRTQREESTLQKIKSNPDITEHNKQKIRKFIDRVRAEGSSKDRIHNYLWSLAKICRHTDLQLGKAQEEDLIRVVGKINNDQLNQKEYSAYSKAEFRKTLSKYYRAFENNPELVEFMQIDPKKKQISKLDAEELPRPEYVEKLVDECRNVRDEALIMTLWDTGGRIEAVLNLKWKNFTPDKENPSISFTERNKTMLRKIPVSSSQPILKRWMSEHPEPEPESYIFTKYEGNKNTKHPGNQPMCYSTAYSMLKRRREDAEIPEKIKTNPHSFRKARATYLASTGMNVNMLAKFMGWSQISTAQKYVSLAQNQLDSAFKEAVGIAEEGKQQGLDWNNESLKPGRCQSCQSIVSNAWNQCPECRTSINQDNLLAVLQQKDKEQQIREEITDIQAKIQAKALENPDLSPNEITEQILQNEDTP